MGSCGNEMDGWVSWLGAARTEKGCAAQRREATSNDCKNRYRPKMYIFKVVQDLCIKSNCMTQFVFMVAFLQIIFNVGQIS